MKRALIPAVLLLSLGWSGFSAPSQDYDELKSLAEQRFAEGSYAVAHELYSGVDTSKLAEEEARWVAFRLADTKWRAAASTRNPDSTELDRAREALQRMFAKAQREEDKDRIWAEVQESLGDWWWDRQDSSNWYTGNQFYVAALDWWAGSADIELARERYLAMVWRMARPHWYRDSWSFGYYGNWISHQVLENAVEIAQAPRDRARAHFLLGLSFARTGHMENLARVEEELEATIALGTKTPWYDDALYHLAEFYESRGRIELDENGNWRTEPAYVEALEYYRRLTREFDDDESRFHDDAERRIAGITATQLSIHVSQTFLPGSKMQFSVNWRNTKAVELSLYRTDLSDDVNLSRKDVGSYYWIEGIKVEQLGRYTSWTWQTGDDGRHVPASNTLPIERELPPGAYVLVASARGKEARALVLVSDAAVVVKSSGQKLLAWFCDVMDGEPIPEARLSFWERYYSGRRWRWREHTASTDGSGVHVFDIEESQSNSEYFVGARSGDRQAFAQGNSPWRGSHSEQWKLYACTDRPAYRPENTVRWKVTARTYDGSVYGTPAGEKLTYYIRDPQGATVEEKEVELNEFGSAWGELETTEEMVLGEYTIFWRHDRKTHASLSGQANLFRLEEYKLPEFEVAVGTAKDSEGRAKLYAVGDEVEAEIESTYYFGGPVAEASVEVLVYQKPFYQQYTRPRQYAWYYQPQHNWGYYYGWGPGQLVLQKTVKTDDEGKARVTFPTPRDTGQDYEYTIEARVTDSSRREVSSTGNVKVTRKMYAVHLEPEHKLYRPLDDVVVEVAAVDPNGSPAADKEGQVTVTRERWREIWADPSGREVTGEELRALQSRSAMFPPPTPPGSPQWELRFRGYEKDVIVERSVETNEAGEASVRFTAPKEGFYRVVWTSKDQRGSQILGETSAWACTTRSKELGYHASGVELVVDSDTFRAGDRAPIMISVADSGRHVLFTVEGDDVYDYRVVHVEGSVKLIHLDLAERHVPNVFLGAFAVTDGVAHADVEEVIVPPVDHFLDVEVVADAEEHEPGSDGTLTLIARDVDGEPVSAELCVSLVDASVMAIQGDYAKDPRPFFFGDKRAHWTSTSSTFDVRPFVTLVEDEEGRLVEKEVALLEKMRRTNGPYGGPGDSVEASGGVYYGGGPMHENEERQRDGKRMPMASASRGLMSAQAGSADSFDFNGFAGNDELDLASLGYAARESNALPGAPGGAESGGIEVTVRSDFRETAVWVPGVVTGADGRATVEVDYPDTLTRWKATVRAMGRDARFGFGSGETRTRMPLMVRLQAPRFFLSGDRVTVSANLNNDTGQDLAVRPEIETENLEVVGRFVDGVLMADGGDEVLVPARGQARVDWLVVPGAGTSAHIVVRGLADEYGDAMERSFPLFPYGIESMASTSGKMRGDEVLVRLDVPADRRADSTAFEVQVAPSLAVTMLDALPYLVDYPYGCTEQTLSRFLPASIVAKTLKDRGLSPEEAMTRVFGGIERDFVDRTHPEETVSLDELDRVTKRGLDRLYDHQHGDGGWSWWKNGNSDLFMSAYVVWGLSLALEAGVDVNRDVLRRGAKFLDGELVEAEERPDLAAWMLHALAVHGAVDRGAKAPKRAEKAFETLWGQHRSLNAYSRALFALAAHHMGHGDAADVLVTNLANGAIVDDAPETSLIQRGDERTHDAVQKTAHWGEDGIWHRWSQGGVEATAFALRAMLAIRPDHELVEPATNWLIKNRRGAQWSNTRDTAIVVLALNDYLEVSGELGRDVEYEVEVNGHVVVKKKVAAEDILAAPATFVVDPELVANGENLVRVRRTSGEGPLYFAARATFFSQEDPITPRGNELFVRREYYRLAGRPTLLKGYVYEKVPVKDGDTLRSGERVEVVVTVESKNHLEYVVFEDLKPAGLEAVQIKSGEAMYARELKRSETEHRFGAGSTWGEEVRVRPGGAPRAYGRAASVGYTGRSRSLHQELRDRKVALFVDRLPQGVWEIRYDLRAEVPGEFHAMPLTGHAMYVPEIRANGTSLHLEVVDRREGE